MSADLAPAVASLAEISDVDLHHDRRLEMAHRRRCRGLLAWLEHACDWELSRRAGIDYELQPPENAIPPEEDAISIKAAMALRATFAADDRTEARAVLALFDAVSALLIGASQKH